MPGRRRGEGPPQSPEHDTDPDKTGVDFEEIKQIDEVDRTLIVPPKRDEMEPQAQKQQLAILTAVLKELVTTQEYHEAEKKIAELLQANKIERAISLVQETVDREQQRRIQEGIIEDTGDEGAVDGAAKPILGFDQNKFRDNLKKRAAEEAAAKAAEEDGLETEMGRATSRPKSGGKPGKVDVQPADVFTPRGARIERRRSKPGEEDIQRTPPRRASKIYDLDIGTSVDPADTNATQQVRRRRTPRTPEPTVVAKKDIRPWWKKLWPFGKK